MANAKLTEVTVREIRTRYETGGTSASRLAAEYGVSRSAVQFVVKRKTWIHVA